MKTTQAQFEQFKKSFLHWQKELGMMEYAASFQHAPMKDSFALIQIDHEGRRCEVALNDHCDGVSVDSLNPDLHGKHEAVHLFLSRITSLAHSRYVIRRELDDAEEGAVRVLERLL